MAELKFTSTRSRRDVENEQEGLYLSDEIVDAISSLPSHDKKIMLYRMNPQHGRPAYLTEFYPEEFSLEFIKSKYGGGRFSIVAETSDGNKKMRFELEGEPKIQGVKKPIKRLVNGELRTIMMTDDELEAMNIKVDSNGFEIINPNSQGDQSGIPYIMTYIQRLEAKLDSMQSAHTNPASSRKEFLEELMLYRQLFQNGKSESPTSMAMTEIANVLKEGIALGSKAANGEISAPSIWETIIDKALPVVTQVLAKIQVNQPQSMPVVPGAPPMANSQDKIPLRQNGFADMLPGAMEAPQANLPSFAKMIAPYVPLLVNSASKGSDPGIWAENIIDQIPPQETGNVLTWLQGETWLNDLASIDQRVALQQAWWQELNAILVEMITNPQGGEDGEAAQ